MEEPLGFLPKARREGIITKEVDGELLVYDRTRDKAHCLNPSAAAVWNLCDGQTTVADIAAKLIVPTPDTRPPTPYLVWLALNELRRSHLLEELGDKALWPQTILGMTRREAVRWIGIGAAVPLVISITAPTAHAAVSNCGLNGAVCTTPPDCCSSVCSPNVPPAPAGKHCVGN
jgi:hypothetical protein